MKIRLDYESPRLNTEIPNKLLVNVFYIEIEWIHLVQDVD
jgi:hypothetical protein